MVDSVNLKLTVIEGDTFHTSKIHSSPSFLFFWWGGARGLLEITHPFQIQELHSLAEMLNIN